jgi:hypothetical protein
MSSATLRTRKSSPKPLITVRGKGEPLNAVRGKKPKQSLYSRALDEADGLDFELAQDVEGIDDEIALLRMKIKSLLETDPENVRLIMQATNTLARLIEARYKINTDQKNALKRAIGGVLKDLAIPLGIKYLP